MTWRAIYLLAVPVLMGAACHSARAERPDMDVTVRLLGYGVYRGLPTDRPDADNRLGIPRYESVIEVRPDLDVTTDRVRLRFKPRLDARFSRRDDGPWPERNDSDTDARVHELYVTLSAGDSHFLSIGRANLQWGPSFLLSPSNPFVPSSARLDPKQEAVTSDYLNWLWIPTRHWSFSLIANTGRGPRQPVGDFEPGYAVKTDYQRGGAHTGLILSGREGEDPRTGLFGSLRFGEAVIGYVEAGAGRYAATAVAGVSYTTWWRWMLSLEYLYHDDGDRHTPAPALVLPAAASADEGEAPWPASARFDSDATVGLMPLRRHYLLLQAFYPQWRRRTDVLIQYLGGLDDGSGRLLLHAETECGRRTRLFAGGRVYHGGPDSEFGALLSAEVTAGLEMAF